MEEKLFDDLLTSVSQAGELRREEAKRLREIMENPPEPNDKLREAYQGYQEDDLNVDRKD
tara:strand:- start:337 stop:516 length:180 start_codon:yes stop_codon:yes gene_type:complete